MEWRGESRVVSIAGETSVAEIQLVRLKGFIRVSPTDALLEALTQASRMTAIISQGGTMVETLELVRQGGRWQGEFAVVSGTYTVALEAHINSDLVWNGTTTAVVKTRQTSAAEIDLTWLKGFLSVSPTDVLPEALTQATRMVARVSRSGTGGGTLTLQRQGGRWQGESLIVEGGSYTVELEAYINSDRVWSGNTTAVVRNGETSTGEVRLVQLEGVYILDPFDSIGLVMLFAESGDIILLKGGIYREAVSLKSRVHLKGISSTNVILRPSTEFSFVLSALDITGAKVSNLDIRGSIEEDVTGIWLIDSNITLENCRIRENFNAIWISGGGTNMIIQDNIISDNTLGIWVTDGAKARIRRNVLERNGVGRPLAAIEVRDSGTAPRIENNTIRGNAGSGILIHSAADGEITGNTINFNGNVGIFIEGFGTNPRVSSNRFSGNTQGGIFVDNASSPSLSGNTGQEVIRGEGTLTTSKLVVGAPAGKKAYSHAMKALIKGSEAKFRRVPAD